MFSCKEHFQLQLRNKYDEYFRCWYLPDKKNDKWYIFCYYKKCYVTRKYRTFEFLKHFPRIQGTLLQLQRNISPPKIPLVAVYIRVEWFSTFLRFSKSNKFLPIKYIFGAQFQKIGKIGRARGKVFIFKTSQGP